MWSVRPTCCGAAPCRSQEGDGHEVSWMSDLFARAPVGWRDALDIAIVTVLIYEVLKLIRGTRAAQMVVGAGLIAGLLVLSHVAHLETVNWLIRNMVGYIVFAAIVLFQSDIRRALAHFGRAPFFRLLSKDARPRKSSRRLPWPPACCRRRVGAIIAIEQRDRAPELHRGRHSARREGELRPAHHDLPNRVAPARRRRHHSRGSGSRLRRAFCHSR